MKWEFVGLEDMTGLPEYRNGTVVLWSFVPSTISFWVFWDVGGLLIDLGVLTLKPNALPIDETSGLPKAAPDDPAVVEWRAMTVVMLWAIYACLIPTSFLIYVLSTHTLSTSDRIATALRTSLNLSASDLSLAQVLESATWKGGREIAQTKRGEKGGGPPLELVSDGTVFWENHEQLSNLFNLPTERTWFKYDAPFEFCSLVSCGCIIVLYKVILGETSPNQDGSFNWTG